MNIHHLSKYCFNIHYVILVLIAITQFSDSHAAEQNSDSSISYSFVEVTVDATNFPVSVPTSYKSRRGYLVVDESRPNGSMLTNKLPVIIVKAKSKSTKPPVLKLSGGPGISGINAAAYPGAYPWLSDRDFILLGQRGTHDAEPALMCTEYVNALSSNDESNEVLIKAAAVCRKRYDEANIDLNAYHSSASAEDIEGLRTMLGINEFSIYAGSYGTRLALTYARDFPNRVSSMILDSPLPHNASFDDEYPDNLKNTLEKIANACEKQPECAASFPNVFERFLSALEQASETPWSFSSTNGVATSLTDNELVSLLNIGTYSGVSRVPQIMDAVVRKDVQLISKLLDRNISPAKFAWGMRLSVWCSESLPYSRRSLGLDSKAFANIDGAVISTEVCEVWNVSKRPEAEKIHTTSSVPTLIIAGEFDALTPPKWGHIASQSLENSNVTTIPYGLHSETNNWSGDGCAMSIANEFFKDEIAFLKQPKAYTQCLNERQPPKFVLTHDD